MKKLVALFVLLALAPAAKAAVSVPMLSDASNNTNATQAQNRNFTGAVTYRIETSTPSGTPIQLVTGAGLLLSVEASSGTSLGYCLGFDSASVSGITNATQGKAITPQVLTSLTPNTAGQGSTIGSWAPASGAPAYFANGLVGISNGANLNCLYKVSVLGATAAGQ